MAKTKFSMINCLFYILIFYFIKCQHSEINEIEYKITPGDGFSDRYKNRGYIYQKLGNATLITIASGPKPSSGFYIDVKKIKIKENKVIIDVFEGSGSGGKCDVITYPYVKVRIYKKILPSDIEVINTRNGENFPPIIS